VVTLPIELFVYLGRKLFKGRLQPGDRNSKPRQRKALPLHATS